MGKWLQEEIDLVKERYSIDGPTVLAEKLGKRPGSISQVAKRLNLKYDDEWSDEHIEILKQRYASDGAAALESILCRSNKTISQKAFRLGLSKVRNLWTKEEEKILLEKYKELGPKEISKIINKTPASIINKAKKFGLTNVLIRWTDDDDNILKENYDKIGPHETAKLLNRSAYGIFKRAGYLGIKITRDWHLLSPEELINLYNTTDLSLIEIAKMYNTEVWTIRRSFEEVGIKFQSKPTMKGSKNRLWTGYEGISGTYFSGIKKSAKERSIEFNITIEFIWDLLIKQNKKCALSGVDIDMYPYNYKMIDKKGITASLDRIDSSKGYFEDNVQWVHKTINHMKMALPQNEFIEWCKLISENN